MLTLHMRQKFMHVFKNQLLGKALLDSFPYDVSPFQNGGRAVSTQHVHVESASCELEFGVEA